MSGRSIGHANLRSAGWILGLSGLLIGAVVAWRVSAIVAARGHHAVGDGRHVESYGFDLDVCLVPRETLVASGLPKDGLPVLDQPRLLSSAGVDSLNRAERGKYLVSSDRVIGVVSGGAARAYPLRLLCWHEIVNDTLGGRPIAVTYSPLCDAAVVFDRVCASDTILFGVSGLLANSNLLMYDRRSAGCGESLWSQLQARAVAGPAAAAGQRLANLPLVVMRWDDWLVRHPAATVVYPEPAYRERYKRNPYGGYGGDDRLRFPVRPLPSATALALKEPILAVTSGGRTVAYPLRWLWSRPVAEATAGAARAWDVEQGGVRLRLAGRAEPPSIWVESVDPSVGWSAVQSFWFAWFALRAPAADEVAGGFSS